MATFDVIVLGLGGMGSAALCHLARRGVRVLGIEQFGLVHDRGSSHGQTRIIRKAYFEHPDYVPLLRRAYALWDELEEQRASGNGTSPHEKLFERCGLLLCGPPEGAVVAGVRRAAAAHNLPIDDLSAAECARRFRQFTCFVGDSAVFEADAGFLRVERCIAAHLDAARAAGATIRAQEPALDWSSDGKTTRVRTQSGDFEAAQLVICGGAWSARLLSELKLPLTVRRKVQFWFEPQSPALSLSAGCPCFGFDRANGFFYGFPAIPSHGENLLKAAHHTGGESVGDPAHVDRTPRLDDFAPVQSFLIDHVPGVAPSPRRSSVCMYTMTPDEHFIIDRHPEHANVHFAAGFSGHGFKFASVIGEILADFATGKDSDAPIGFLRLSRLGRELT